MTGTVSMAFTFCRQPEPIVGAFSNGKPNVVLLACFEEARPEYFANVVET